jgi:hypothetical protein
LQEEKHYENQTETSLSISRFHKDNASIFLLGKAAIHFNYLAKKKILEDIGVRRRCKKPKDTTMEVV